VALRRDDLYRNGDVVLAGDRVEHYPGQLWIIDEVGVHVRPQCSTLAGEFTYVAACDQRREQRTPQSRARRVRVAQLARQSHRVFDVPRGGKKGGTPTGSVLKQPRQTPSLEFDPLLCVG
jgi:hypothetical protein